MFLMFLISLSFQLNCFHWNPAQHLVGWSPSIGHVHPAGFRARSKWIFNFVLDLHVFSIFLFRASFEALAKTWYFDLLQWWKKKNILLSFWSDLRHPTPRAQRHNWIQLVQWTFQRGRSPELRQQEPVEDHFVSDSPCRTWQGHRGWAPKKC